MDLTSSPQVCDYHNCHFAPPSHQYAPQFGEYGLNDTKTELSDLWNQLLDTHIKLYKILEPPPFIAWASILDMGNHSVNLTSTKVFKKSAQNNKITLYLGTRDLVISDQTTVKIQGVVYVDPDYLQDKKIFGQITLTFRYGREDEEVMGLKFCNEAIMCLAQLHPPHEKVPQQSLTPLQDALMKRLGPNAHPFTMEITPLAPPSVQLVPAKEYNGAPIGTSYDIRAFAAHRADEKQHRRNTVRMGIRVIQRASMPPKSSNSLSQQPPSEENPPRVVLSKPFLLSDGQVRLETALDKAVYSHGDSVYVTVSIINESKKQVRRLKILVIQHVDVCMFSNGKFKNIVAMVDGKEDCPLRAGTSLHKTYSMNPAKGVTKNWIALEDSYVKTSSSLASTVVCNAPEERNVFAIYVSYYVKVKLVVGAIGSKISVKLPFTLMPSQTDADLMEQFPGRYSPTHTLTSDPTNLQTETIGIDDNFFSGHEIVTLEEHPSQSHSET